MTPVKAYESVLSLIDREIKRYTDDVVEKKDSRPDDFDKGYHCACIVLRAYIGYKKEQEE